MKSFIATLFASVVLASDIKGEVERAAADASREIEQIQKTDWDFEIEREITMTIRDLQCTWANFEPVTEGGCPDWEQTMKQFCADNSQKGYVWVQEWYSCMREGSEEWQDFQRWSMENSIKKLSKVHSLRKAIEARNMVSYQATVSPADVEAILEPVAKGQKEGEELGRQINAALDKVAEEYAPKFEQYSQSQQQIEQEASFQLADYLVRNIKIDGKQLSELIGTPEQWVQQSQAKTMQKASDKITITWEGPSGEELEALYQSEVEPSLKRLEELYDTLAEEGANINQEAVQKYEKMSEPIFEEQGQIGEKLVQEVGSWVKTQIAQNVTVDAPVALAEKHAAQESNSIATGVGAGVVGALVGCAVFAVVNRQKQVAAQEQPLL